MRLNLKVFRVSKNLTQAEIAERIGCTSVTYASIESGRRQGRQEFWTKLKVAFDIPDDEMWHLMVDVVEE